jgi:methylphosphotriester-DNA--protein-cysteine methyltransferase
MSALLSEKIMYKAILNRDISYDGIFYTGVKITGIFCSSSCPARSRIKTTWNFFLRQKMQYLPGTVHAKRTGNPSAVSAIQKSNGDNRIAIIILWHTG